MQVINDPQTLRARIAAIRNLSIEAEGQDKKILMCGVVPFGYEERMDEEIARLKDSQPKDPLTLTEMTTFNTWYQMHPEKVAGEMKQSSSIMFPVSVKGNLFDVEKMFSFLDDEVDDLTLLELEAEAALAILILNKK